MKESDTDVRRKSQATSDCFILDFLKLIQLIFWSRNKGDASAFKEASHVDFVELYCYFWFCPCPCEESENGESFVCSAAYFGDVF